jgi:hypothetical protein
MKNFPIGALLALAAVILHTAPLLAGVRLWQQAQTIRAGTQDRPLPACLPHEVACQLSELTRYTGAWRAVFDSLTMNARHIQRGKET